MAPLGLFSFILVTSFVLGETVRLEIMPNIFVKPLDIAVGLISIFGIVQLIILKKLDLLYKDKIFKWVLLFFLIGFISLILNSRNLSLGEFLSSFLYEARFLSYAFLFIAIKYTKPYSYSSRKRSGSRSLNRIVYMLLTVGIVFLVFGFVQYLFYPNLRNLYYLGWDEHIYRMFSTFLDPNFAGAFFVLFLIFILGLFFYFLQNKKIFLKNFTLIIMFLTLISIYLTFSRSALVMLFVSTFVFLFLVKKLKWILVVVAAFLVFTVFSSRSFYIENINLLRTASSQARIDSAKIAVHIIKENPILGVGFNSYRYSQIRYGFREKEKALKSHADSGTDNSFLFVMSTTGIFGFVVYIYLLYKILKHGYLRYKNSKISSLSYYLSIVVIVSFIGIIINSMFINSLFYSFIMLWLWAVLGLNEKA